MASVHKPAVMILGLDGATFKVIDPLIAAGELPGLASIMSGGHRSVLRSTIPPLTPAAWSTMTTGTNPGKHGIFGFLRANIAERQVRIVTSDDVGIPSVWEVLSAEDIRVGCFSFPWTYPPKPVNGFMIAGLNSPKFDERMFYPPELHDKLVSALGSFSMRTPQVKHGVYELKTLEEEIGKWGAMSSWLMDEYRPDVFGVVFSQTDWIQHYFWGVKDVKCDTGDTIHDIIAHTYKIVDEQVQTLLDRHMGPDTVVLVVSDHGGTGIRSGIELNEWFKKIGLLVPAKKQETSGVRSIFRMQKAVTSVLPRWLLDRLAPLTAGTRRGVWFSHLLNSVDWESTRAICIGEYGAVLLQGDDKQVQETTDIIKKEALNLRDPETGEPVLGDIFTREEIYHGDMMQLAPHLWIQPRDYQYLILTDWKSPNPLISFEPGKIFAESFFAGGHDMNGVFMAKGRHLEGTDKLQTADLADVAPTILGLVGIEAPPYIDGQALVRAADQSELRKAQIQASGPQQGDEYAYTREEEEAVAERLQDLGYL